MEAEDVQMDRVCIALLMDGIGQQSSESKATERQKTVTSYLRHGEWRFLPVPRAWYQVQHVCCLCHRFL